MKKNKIKDLLSF